MVEQALMAYKSVGRDNTGLLCRRKEACKSCLFSLRTMSDSLAAAIGLLLIFAGYVISVVLVMMV
jgi:hypothetical protein